MPEPKLVTVCRGTYIGTEEIEGIYKIKDNGTTKAHFIVIFISNKSEIVDYTHRSYRFIEDQYDFWEDEKRSFTAEITL